MNNIYSSQTCFLSFIPAILYVTPTLPVEYTAYIPPHYIPWLMSRLWYDIIVCFLCLTDIDECATGADVCNDQTGPCVNNEGDYDCDCLDGYTYDSTNKKCNGTYSR